MSLESKPFDFYTLKNKNKSRNQYFPIFGHITGSTFPKSPCNGLTKISRIHLSGIYDSVYYKYIEHDNHSKSKPGACYWSDIRISCCYLSLKINVYIIYIYLYIIFILIVLKIHTADI